MAESTLPQDSSKNTDLGEEQLESINSTENLDETEANYSDELFEMYCESCNREGTHVLATSFCSTCVDFLCQTCLKYHNKFLPDHQYLDGDKLPQDIFFGNCQNHKDEILKFFCSSCTKVTCSICKRNDHKTSGKPPDSCVFKYLPDVVKSFEIKSEMKSLFAKSHDFSEMLSKSESKMLEHLKKINDIQKHGKLIVKKETEAMFQRYVTELQILEEKTDTKKNSDESNIRSVGAQYVQIKSEIDKLAISADKFSISHIKQKYKLIMELNTVRRDLESAEKTLQTYLLDISVKSNALETDVKTQVDSITERVKLFAPFMMTVHKMDIGKANEKVQRKKAHQINEIDVSHYTDDKDCHINDCCLLSPKYLVICDENNSSLKLVDVKEEEVVSVRSLRTYPEAVTAISSTKIAVAQANEHNYDRSIIQFLTLTKTKSFYFQKGCIKLDMSCDDILYIDDKLIIALSENNRSKVQVLDMDGDVLETVHSLSWVEEWFGAPVSLAVDSSDGVYVADSRKGRLTKIHIDFTKYDRSYEDEWLSDSESSTETVGKFIAKFGCPRKITTDLSGYLYVIDSSTRCIHSIHPSYHNSEVKMVADFDDGWQPESLSYCDTNDLLYVGQGQHNSIRVFKVEEATFKKHITLEKVVKWQEV